ncbi:MAG: hypothetical protein ACLFMO_04820, partial [Eubacteriales bacterium]
MGAFINSLLIIIILLSVFVFIFLYLKAGKKKSSKIQLFEDEEKYEINSILNYIKESINEITRTNLYD